MLPYFLLAYFHLPLSHSYLASLEKESPIQTWPAGRLRSRELEDTCTNADGWHEWKWFQIGDVVGYMVFQQGRAGAGHLCQGGILISRGGTNHVLCVCVCVICDRVQLLTLAKVQSLSYVCCFVSFTFAFEIDHVQQGGERKVGGTVTRLQQGPSLITK